MKNTLFTITNILAIILSIGMLLTAFFATKQFYQANQTSPQITFSDIISEQDENQDFDVHSEYGKEIIQILSKYDLDTANANIVEGWLASYPPEEMANYLSSMDHVLTEQLNHSKSNPNFNIDNAKTINKFRSMYSEKYAKLNQDGMGSYESKLIKGTSIGLVFFALFMFIILMTVPVLIQIEKNTRKESSN